MELWKENEKEVVILESVERINWFSWMVIVNLILYIFFLKQLKENEEMY